MFFSKKLGGFLVYRFMKSWDGVRLPLINTVSIYIPYVNSVYYIAN
jgi:hypothetical protein